MRSCQSFSTVENSTQLCNWLIIVSIIFPSQRCPTDSICPIDKRMILSYKSFSRLHLNKYIHEIYIYIKLPSFDCDYGVFLGKRYGTSQKMIPLAVRKGPPITQGLTLQIDREPGEIPCVLDRFLVVRKGLGPRRTKSMKTEEEIQAVQMKNWLRHKAARSVVSKTNE